MQGQVRPRRDPADECRAEGIEEGAPDVDPARIRMGNERREIGEGFASTAHLSAMSTWPHPRQRPCEAPGQEIEQMKRPFAHDAGTGILSKAAEIRAGRRRSRRGSAAGVRKTR